jgi:SAM-dependent methyltransferase
VEGIFMSTASPPITISQSAREIFQCPNCKAPLANHPVGATNCGSCGHPVTLQSDGLWVVGSAIFPDHWAATPERRARFEEVGIPSEKAHNDRFTRHFTLPLLQKLFGDRRDIRILSCGCGLGFDVDIFRSMGYDAWGNDLGNRCDYWKHRLSPDKFVRCGAEDLPFPDNYFDFVQSHLVLEHVGVVGDTTRTRPDYWEIRRGFLQSMLRVVKPGGYLNVSTPNRTFPIDPGHAENTRLGMRIHGPFDRFLTSYGDMRRFCPGHRVIPVSPRGYYAGACVGKYGSAKQLFNTYLDSLDKLPFLLGTCFNPLLNALVQKSGDR